MATKQEDRVKYYSPDGDKTKYLENEDLPARLKAAHNKKANFTMPTAKQTGSGDRKAQVAKRQAKNKKYVARKRTTPAKRSTVAGNTGAAPLAQTFAQNGQQRPVRQVQNRTPTSDYLRGPYNAPGPQTVQAQMPPSYNPFPQQNQMPYQTYAPFAAQPYQPQGQPSGQYGYGEQVQMNNIAPRPSVFGQQQPPRDYAGMLQQMPMGLPYSTPQRPNPWSRAW